VNTTQTLRRVKTEPKSINIKSWATVLLAVLFTSILWFGLPSLTMYMRVAFIVFGLATLGWMLTDINDTYIALFAAVALTLAGLNTPNDLFATLGDPTIWLLLSSFIVAAGVTKSGLIHRLTKAVSSRAKTTKHLFYSLTFVLMATAFFIPATSGRAALMLPLFIALNQIINNRRINRALALLFPTIILLSASGSLIGAGAHLVTIDVLARAGAEKIGFGQWMLWGLPFALISCFISTWMIMHLFLNKEERNQRLSLDGKLDSATGKNSSSRLSRAERLSIFVVLSLIILWMTESIHGIDNTLVAVLGALAITLPNIGVLSFKDAFKNIEWNMILFMAATLKIGESLIESGAAEWLIQNLFSKVTQTVTPSILFIVAMIAAISLVAHLFINSRTARSSVLIPLIVLLSLSLGYDPTTFGFLSTVAAGFCLTLPVSAKPVAMFSQIENVETYQPKDLLKLSSFLLPIHLGLLLIFTFNIWPLLGLSIERQDSNIYQFEQNEQQPFEWMLGKEGGTILGLSKSTTPESGRGINLELSINPDSIDALPNEDGITNSIAESELKIYRP
jgi:solute carrier family 13 (sodium-dependent dicarboxylate transporter), member 2/3/5